MSSAAKPAASCANKSPPEMNAMNATAADWTHIEPLLDEAMHALDDTDRTAVLLRYFENKSLREVGETLGTTDDAAQKRVSRAVERLREFFAKRGVTVGASGLVVVISANAVQAAPVGLAVTISTAAALAGTTIATTATATATKAIAMTTLQKTLITATLVVAVGTGIYEARQASRLRNQVQTLQQQQIEQIQQLSHERDDATNQLAALRNENERLNRNTAELLKLRGEVGPKRKPKMGGRRGGGEIGGARGTPKPPTLAPPPQTPPPLFPQPLLEKPGEEGREVKKKICKSGGGEIKGGEKPFLGNTGVIFK